MLHFILQKMYFTFTKMLFLSFNANISWFEIEKNEKERKKGIEKWGHLDGEKISKNDF